MAHTKAGTPGPPESAGREPPAASGAMYENGAGWRLHTKGNEAMWNTALRSAPETCRQVMVPR